MGARGKFIRRSIQSLSARHSSLLKMIESHGITDGGQITLNYINGNVADIRICNNAKRNAISGVMMNELAAIVDELNKADHLIALIIRGGGDFFCSGADLTLARDYINTPERGRMMSAFMTEALNCLRESPLVSVAMLSGSALGGGAEVSTTADYRIYCQPSHTSPTSVTFVHAKLGVTPGWGGAARLQSIVGRGNALKLLGTSCSIFGDEAIRIGFAESIVTTTSEQDVIDAAMSFLDPFLKQRYPEAVRSAKRVVSALAVNPITGREVESNAFASRWAGKDNTSAIVDRQAGGSTKK